MARILACFACFFGHAMLQTFRRPPRLLVVEGNTREGRAAYAAGWRGLTPAAAYAEEIGLIAPEAVTDLCFPADEGANLPDGAGLETYDGIFLTGSGLHIYHDDPAIRRQVALMQAIYRSGTPCFGSCWGIQMGTVAAGGAVIANPRGREAGFARRIVPSEAGAGHALLAGRPKAFDAPAIHLDTIAELPGDATILAANGYSAVQAVEIRYEGGVFWGVQYHPEFSLGQLASILRRITPILIAEGFCRDEAAAARWVTEIETLDADPQRADLAWAHGLDAQVLDARLRVTELRNFLEMRVKPGMSVRGRA